MMRVPIVATNNYRCVLGILALLFLPAESVVAQDVSSARKANRNTLFSSFSFEGEIVQKAGADWNVKLDNNNKERSFNLEPAIELALSFALRGKSQAYLNLQYGREMEIEDEDDERERSYKSSLEVDEGFLQFTDHFDKESITKKTSLTIGRFSLSDKREWFFDKSLDGVLISFELEPIDTRFSLSLNREELFGSDLLRHNEVDPVNNFIVVAEHEPFKNLDLELSAYSIIRHDRSADNESPRFYGVTSNGKLVDERISWWAGLAWARGEEDEENIKGFGFDIGATIFLRSRFRPYIILAYAFGSGDGDTDSDFRQTDLQGNSDKFGGVTSFKYYGELVDPELSNLQVVTTGMGFRYRPAASIDIVLHRFRQDVPLDELRSSDLKEDPNGDSKNLGVELDIVWGTELTSNVESELVLGYFIPGSAFDDNTDNAFLVNAKLSYKF
ncbi:MAG: alginate export family protein [Granulosicoccus sp.]